MVAIQMRPFLHSNLMRVPWMIQCTHISLSEMLQKISTVMEKIFFLYSLIVFLVMNCNLVIFFSYACSLDDTVYTYQFVRDVIENFDGYGEKKILQNPQE